MSKFRFVAGSVILLVAMACKDALVVEDPNDPDRNRALSRPSDVESFIGSTYAQIQNGTIGGTNGGNAVNDNLQTQMQVMGMENTSALANFAMGPRGAIPRTPIDNSRNGTGDAGNYRDFVVLHRAARMATIGIDAMNKLPSLDTLGTRLGSQAQDARARSFARFVEGVAYGNLAMSYDSAALLNENDNLATIQPLVGYQQVMNAAFVMLDSAITIARKAPGSFPLPATWVSVPSTVKIDTTLYFQWIRSYKARFRAGVARTPAERAAADWNAIIADANAGITADFNIAANPSAGWDVAWPVQAYATGSANWHQMSQFWVGMADSSGGYDGWLATTPANRAPFLVITREKRFPQGATRSAQQGDTLRAGYKTFAGFPYIRNRSAGDDQPGQPLQISMYDFYRSRTFFVANRIGNYPVMTRAEIRLLAVEGYIRTGNIAAALVRIDSSRVTNGGLPALVGSGIADTLTPIPGGVSCVPRVPDPNATAGTYKASKCGNLWDAMKWEYRLETMYTGYGMWYFAGRGWGDLPEGTALYWPVPNEEMDTRRQAFYPSGGVGGVGGAPKGNYGLFAGGVY